jgi:predicted DsbA family dithiol-disulfide isomerase
MGLVDKLKQEFDLTVEWLGFEIHPDTPREGMLLSTLFPQLDSRQMFSHLQTMAAPYGITFADLARISNSRLSLEASEFAKEQGRFDQLHRLLFRAYFSQARDIGDIEVLAQLGEEAGLDPVALTQALRAGTYHPIIDTMRKEAVSLGVTAAPTFLIDDRDRIIGAQSIDVFRKKLGKR